MAAWRDFGISPTGGLPGMAYTEPDCRAGSRTRTRAGAEAQPFRAESCHAQVNALAQDSLR